MQGFASTTLQLAMKTADKKCHVKRIPSAKKCEMALQAIRGQQTVTELSKKFQCSRTTVHAQKRRALEAAAKVFDETDEEVLSTIAVSNSLIHTMVVALYLVCGSSYRGIMFFLESLFGYSISLGSVFNLLDVTADKAASINGAYELSAIKSSAADEVFHRNHPTLSIVDIESRFCALLAKANDRDHETWGIHLLDLQARGYAPTTSIVDDSKGLIKPDFDTAKSHACRRAAWHKAFGAGAESGVYLGGDCAQSKVRIGLGDLIFNDFNLLAACAVGSVTCQTRPFGLDNCAN